MARSFEEDDRFDGEWVEICDMEGRWASLRHLATIRLGKKTYVLLGTEREDALERGELMLLREDQTVDGAQEYVVARDEGEIERVVGEFAAHLMAEDMSMAQDDGQMVETCGCTHRFGEFCYCDDPAYLQ